MGLALTSFRGGARSLVDDGVVCSLVGNDDEADGVVVCWAVGVGIRSLNPVGT